MAKGGSWGHAVEAVTDQLAQFASGNVVCSTKCEQPISHLISWWFTGGINARISRIQQLCCAKHACAFAAKHNLGVPAREVAQ